MRRTISVVTVVTAIALTGCVSQSSSDGDTRYSLLGPAGSFLTSGRPERGSESAITSGNPNRLMAYTDLGQETREIGGQAGEPIQVTDNGSKVTLNFVNVELQEFVRLVFDEVLKENVVVDPSLTGRITLRTAEPVTQKSALSLIRNVLQLHGASLAKADGAFRVAARGSGNEQRTPGENIRIVPIRFIKAEQARAALQPFVASGTEVVANSEGRYIILSGSPTDLDPLAQLLETLDVDQMLGLSFALLPLKEAGAATVATEITQMFGSESNETLKAIAIQRMNAVLLMTRSADALNRARTWIERLDQSSRDNQQVRVFPIQNRRAADIAKILNGMLIEQSGGSNIEAASAAKIESAALSTSTDGQNEAEVNKSLQGAQVKADTSTNSLVVMARPESFTLIESTIRRLDVLPTQVLIEATIAEVGLNDALRYGVRWYFQQGPHGVSVSDGSSGNAPGFNYVFNVPQGRLVMNALEKVTNLEIISSPALTVLDNETASLTVGDQVPIATRSARSVTSPEAPVVNDIELKDTGIILKVTPRVNASGLVMLDIAQEVSDVVPTSTSTIDSPTIRQRKINSSVAVQSGAEIVLGGLISSNRQTAKDGVPILKDLPILGAAFTSNGVKEQRRTELLVIIRPTVIANRVDLYRVTEEIKAGMKGVGRIGVR